MTKKAIQLIKYGDAKKAFSFVPVPPLALAADDLAIEVERFGINYADVMARNGLYKEAPPIPTVLGYEVVGIVSKLGANAPKELLGKRVVAFTRFGGYSQVTVTKHYAVAEIGDYDGNKALCLATQYVTAYYMSHVACNVQKGDNVLIHAAAGGVGTALIQLLKEKEVNIIAKVGSDHKKQHLTSLGVQHIVNYNTGDYAQTISTILGGNKLNISFNPAGGASFKKDMQLLQPTGKLLLFGGSERSGKKWGILSDLNFVKKMGLIIPIALMGNAKSIIGINMLRVADFQPYILQDCLKSVVKLAREEKLQPHVDKVFPAEQIAEAHQYLASGNSVGKITLEW